LQNDDVYYYSGKRVKLEGERENRGICAKKWISVKSVVLMATPCTKLLGGGSGVTSSRKEVRGAKLVRRTPAFLSRDRAAVIVDNDVERCHPRYHETSLALEGIEESGAAVGNPCKSVRLRSLIDTVSIGTL
jgi:hypothetical protein